MKGKILKLVKKDNNNEDGNVLDTRKHEIFIRYNQDIEQVEYNIITNSPKLTVVGLLIAVSKLILDSD